MNKKNKMKETLFLFVITILLKSANVCAQILQGKTIELENIETNEKSQQMISTEGQAEFNISKPANYKFLKYKIINN